ncbi:RNA polymerase sigma factor [Pedococcus sp. P5_B7]
MSAGTGEPLVAHEVHSESDRVRLVFEASYRRLVGQLYGVCRDLTEAEEVVAEAFARAVQHRRTFARLDNPEAWLRTVAVNVSRTRARRRRLLGDRDRAQVARHPMLEDDRLALMAALRALPANQREAVALHYLADLPVQAVAEATGVPVGTVKTRLRRGRAALALLLADPPDPRHEEAPDA